MTGFDWKAIRLKNIRTFESVIDDCIISKIKQANWCADLGQYAAYKCGIDGLLAAAYLFCPQIIQVKEYIFIKQFWNCSIEESIKCIDKLEKQYHNDKKAIEMSVNTWSIGDLFLGDSGELMDNEEILTQFGDALVYFWGNRVKDLFPDRKIVVELGNDLMGEFGPCITMYEDDKVTSIHESRYTST